MNARGSTRRRMTVWGVVTLIVVMSASLCGPASARTRVLPVSGGFLTLVVDVPKASSTVSPVLSVDRRTEGQWERVGDIFNCFTPLCGAGRFLVDGYPLPAIGVAASNGRVTFRLVIPPLRPGTYRLRSVELRTVSPRFVVK